MPEDKNEFIFEQKNNPEFREHYVSWVINYCKDEGRKWGHISFAKALIKNAYPKNIEDKAFVKDNSIPFYETLRSLLYRKGITNKSVISLKNNKYLLHLIFLYIYNVDYDFLKK